MARYRVEAPNGKTYEVEGPAGASKDEVIQAVQVQIQQQERARYKQEREDFAARTRAAIPPEPVKTTFLGNVAELGKGVIPGAVGLGETAAAGLAALLPEEQEKAVRGKAAEISKSVRDTFAPAAGYEDSVWRKLGEGLGSTLPFFALGPLGLAGRVAAGGLGAAAGAGEARQSAEAKGTTESERRLATILGTPVGLLDMLAPQVKAASNIIFTAFKRGGVEGATEAAQKVAQNLIAKGVYDPNQPIFAGSGEEGAYGAGVGALSSLLLDMVLPKRFRGRGTTGEETNKTPPETTGLPETASQGELFTQEEAPVPAQPAPAQGELFTQEEAPVPEQQAPAQAEAQPGQGDLFNQPAAEPAPQTQLELPLETPAQPAQPAQPAPEQPAQPAPEQQAPEQPAPEQPAPEQQAPEQQATWEGFPIKVLGTPFVYNGKSYTRVKFQDAAGTFEGAGARQDFVLTDEIKVNQQAPAQPAPAQPAPEQPAPAQPAPAPAQPAPEQPAPEQQAPAQPAPAPEQPAPKQPAPKQQAPEQPTQQGITQEQMDQMGIPKTAPIRNRIVNKDLSIPEDLAYVQKQLATFATNTKVAADTRARVNSFLDTFKGATDVSATESEPTTTGVSPSSTGTGAGAGDIQSTGRTTAPTNTGVGSNRDVAGRTDERKTEQPTALKEKKKEVKKEIKLTDKPINELTYDDWTSLTGSIQGPARPNAANEDISVDDAKLLRKMIIKIVKDGVAAGKTSKQIVDQVEALTKGGLRQNAIDNIYKLVESQKKESKPSKPKEAKPTEKKEEKPKAKNPVQEQATKNYMTAAKNDQAKAIDYLAADMYNASYPEKNEYKELRRISSDLLAGKMPSGMKFGKENSHATGTGGKFGKAFYESLSEADQAALIKRLEHYFVTTESKAKSTLEQINAQQRLARANKEAIEEPDEFDLLVSAELTRPLHPAAVDALIEGNVLEALRIVSNQNLGRASDVAAKLAGVMGNTKVEFVKNLKNESGQPVAGMYDPKTNTIRLNEDTGLNVHTLLHEATHAATSHVLANKQHPVTKQLTQLYNDVKGWLDTAYGATSLDEFVGEAMSNPEFQAKLQAINPKGDKITAWQRFVNTIGNFLRRMVGMDTKPLGSALDTTDALVTSILAPAPNMRNAGVLLSMSATGNSSQVFKNIDTSFLNAPSIQEGLDNVHEILTGKLPNTVKNLVRSALPLNIFVEEAQRYVPKAKLVDKLVNQRSGSESLRNQSIEPVLAKVETWAGKNPGKLDAFNFLVYESTLTQVDPTKPRKLYENKTDKDGNKLDDAWDNMQDSLKTVGPEGAALYKTMRDTYKKLYDEILRIINFRIDAVAEDKDRAKVIKTEIYSRLMARGGLDPYFPLTREGDKWLSYHANGELHVEAFESERARKRAMKEYEAAGATNLQKFANASSINYNNAPPTSFVNGVLKTLEANKVNPEVTEEIMRFFLTTLPETSFAQSLQARKGTAGYKKDAVRALRMKTMSISRQIANMEYGAKLSQLNTEIEEDFKAAGRPEDAAPYVEELAERIKFAKSPQIPKWAKLAKSFGFTMTLGFNPSSALVNMAQVPMVVVPFLGGRYGAKATTQAIAHATRIYTQSGFNREVKTIVPVSGAEKTKVNAGLSLDNYDFDAASTPDDVKQLKILSEVAGDLGQLNRSQIYDTLDVTDPKGGILDRVNAAAGFAFHHGERMNRQVSMIAAYNLELDRMKADGRRIDKSAMTEAAETAIYLTEMTNGGTAAAGAPRLAQSGLGSVMFMFKRYGVAMNYLLFKTTREALYGADDKTRVAAMSQVAGIYGSAALLAGARGLPMFGVLAMLYNLFKDDDEDDFETATRKFLGEGLYSGAINATTGLDVASRIGLSGLIFRDNKYSDSTSVVASLMETMGGPVFGVASRVERGLKLISEGHTERGLEAILPSAAANLLKSYRYANEGTTTLRGDPITGDISSWNVFAQAFGFAPAEYTRQLEINAIEKGVDKATNEKKTKLLRQFYVATRFSDTDTARETMQELIKLQQKHPGLGISAKTIIASMKQHMRTSATMYHGITLSKGMRNELLQNAREFDEGYGGVSNPFDDDEE
jgi:hypothetical protein